MKPSLIPCFSWMLTLIFHYYRKEMEKIEISNLVALLFLSKFHLAKYTNIYKKELIKLLPSKL